MRTPEDTAKYMVAYHGSDLAAEYAHGYAVGMYFEQTPEGKAYWLEVSKHIALLPKWPKPAQRSMT